MPYGVSVSDQLNLAKSAAYEYSLMASSRSVLYKDIILEDSGSRFANGLKIKYEGAPVTDKIFWGGF